jgi:hypothetical protein
VVMLGAAVIMRRDRFRTRPPTATPASSGKRPDRR